MNGYNLVTLNIPCLNWVGEWTGFNFLSGWVSATLSSRLGSSQGGCPLAGCSLRWASHWHVVLGGGAICSESPLVAKALVWLLNCYNRRVAPVILHPKISKKLKRLRQTDRQSTLLIPFRGFRQGNWLRVDLNCFLWSFLEMHVSVCFSLWTHTVTHEFPSKPSLSLSLSPVTTGITWQIFSLGATRWRSG